MDHICSLDQGIGKCAGPLARQLRAYLVCRATATMVIALLLTCLTHPSAAAEGGARHPVLFVHGSGLTSELWVRMAAEMHAAGYPTAYLKAIDMLPRDGSNPRAARRYIRRAVDDLLANARNEARSAGTGIPRQVDIVAHSMGAVSSRWYISRMQPELVRVWIGIAPANHGTNALCGFDGGGNRELCPAFASDAKSSEVQFLLNGSDSEPKDETPYGLGSDGAGRVRQPPDSRRAIAYFTIRIDPDQWIIPADSALLEGAGGFQLRVAERWFDESSSGNFLFKAPVSHDDLPKEPRIIDLVLTILKAAEEQYPQSR